MTNWTADTIAVAQCLGTVPVPVCEIADDVFLGQKNRKTRVRAAIEQIRETFKVQEVRFDQEGFGYRRQFRIDPDCFLAFRAAVKTRELSEVAPQFA